MTNTLSIGKMTQLGNNTPMAYDARDDELNSTDQNNGTSRGFSGPQQLSKELMITLYSCIFVIGVVGNALVIVTLIQNKRMRTVTNVLLLNLSISDLLLVVLCMPFTLIGVLLKNFIFGPFMCPTIRYLQGVSVGVSAFTLVAIAMERFFAICQPLRSRRWQTLSHSYKLIVAVWITTGIINIPTAVFTKLWELKNGAHKCIEELPDPTFEKIYQVFIATVFLLLPFILMLLAYTFIASTLWQGIRMDMRSNQDTMERDLASHSKDADDYELAVDEDSEYTNTKSILNGKTKRKQKRDIPQIRRTQTEKSLQAKKRVIKMLFAVVLEFFICWTPSFVVQTWGTFDPDTARQHVSPIVMSSLHLFSYISTCCNPITYCFMNKKFRQGFLQAFRCCGYRRGHARKTSDYSCSNTNSSRTVFTSLRGHEFEKEQKTSYL
ncbi:cholecystokinin receptor type A-like isoform X2 [Lineus longissimus]|uniref:cholecystokinin receptor type A-like isoform X2 n=1 Tax=Lineus longissimus TaxID=88925 RepID=UPI00315CEAF5